jgi:hypothetical protein
MIATTSSAGPKRLADGRSFQTRSILSHFEFVGHGSAFWPDESRWVVSGVGIRVVDLAAGLPLLSLQAEFGFGLTVVVSPDGKYVVQLADTYPEACIWQAPSWKEIEAMETLNKDND